MGLSSNFSLHIWTSPCIHLFVGMAVLANDVKYCLMRPSVILFIYFSHTREPLEGLCIYLQGFSENYSEC